jgi:hypothetical protein
MLGGSLLLALAASICVVVSLVALASGESPPSWALVGIGLVFIFQVAVRPWMHRWGASSEEAAKDLPGDETVPEPGVQQTRAITIEAPIQQVWPWLAQIGQDRGGFYSYEWLENLAGCHMRNADRVHPEWQAREPGDTVPLHPAAGLKLRRFEPYRSLAFEGGWYFVLEPLSHRRTRLLARSRTPRGVGRLIYSALLEIPHFVMERKMLKGIKARAEGQATQRQAIQRKRSEVLA